MTKNNNTLKIENRITKKEFTDIIAPYARWTNACNHPYDKIRDSVTKIKTIIPNFLDIASSNKGLNLDKSTVSKRAFTCYNDAINYLNVERFGESLHELHDSIYGFGENLDQGLTDLEYFLIFNWLTCFEFSNSVYLEKLEKKLKEKNSPYQDWEQAYKNIKQFIRDSEVQLELISTDYQKNNDEGTFLFRLRSEYDTYHTVEMPPQDLYAIRYDKDNGDMLISSKFRVDEKFNYWWFALITKEYILQDIERKMSTLEENLKNERKKMNQLIVDINDKQ